MFSQIFDEQTNGYLAVTDSVKCGRVRSINMSRMQTAALKKICVLDKTKVSQKLVSSVCSRETFSMI